MRVEILEHIDLPDQYLDDGKLYLDIDSNKLETKINNIGLNNKDKNTNNATLSFEVPYTAKNRMILGGRADAHGRAIPSSPIPIFATDGAYILEQDSIVCLGKNDATRAYRIQLTNKASHPISLASKLPLNDIELSDFIFSKENVEAQFANFQYADVDPGFHYGFAFFGGTYQAGKFVTEDLRPVYSPLHLFREGFKSLGWTFSSPLLETDIWRRVWCYLSDETYGGGSQDNLERYRFVLTRTTPFALEDYFDGTGGSIKEWTVVLDNYGGYDEPWYIQPYGLTHKLTLEYEIDASTIAREEEIKIIIALGEFIIAETTIFLVDEKNEFKETISGVFDQYINSTTYPALIVRFVGSKIRSLEIKKLKFYNEPLRLRYIENQYIEMSEPLSSKISLSDLLEGIQHLTCGLPDIDWGKNHIELKVPYDVDIWGQSVQGHLDRDNLEDLSSIILKVSQSLSIPSVRQSRYIRFGYKRSTDDHIRQLSLERGTELFDKLVDLGDDYEERTSNKRNPLFEPTDFAPVPSVSDDVPPHLAIVSDNSDGQVSFDLGPRLFMATGVVAQNYKDIEENTVGAAELNWHDTVLTSFVTYFQSVEGKNVEVVGLDTTLNLVYGTSDNDAWNKYLKEKSLSNLLSQVITFKFTSPIGDFSLMDLSTIKGIQYGYEYIKGFIKSIRYNHLKETGTIEIQTQIDTIADLDNVIESDEAVIICGEKKPEIKQVTGLGVPPNTDMFTLVGYLDEIDIMTWEYQVIQSDETWPATWQSFTVVTSPDIEATRTRVAARNRIRLRIEWLVNSEGYRCPDTTIIKELDPCRNRINIQFDKIFRTSTKIEGKWINLNFSEIQGSITAITATVSINQGAPVPYTIDPVSLIGDKLFFEELFFPSFTLSTLVIDFADGCQYVLPNPVSEFDVPLLSIVGEILDGETSFTKVSGGSRPRYIPNDGTIDLSKPYVTRDFYYKNDKTDEFGEIWNGSGGDGIGPAGS